MEVPNWLRVVFLILSLLSFQPQIARLYHRRDSAGISLYYVLFNLIIATELFSISFFHIANNRYGGTDSFVHDPPSFGDLLNLAQFTVVWMAWVIILALCIIYSHTTSNQPNPSLIISIYISFLLISIIPLFTDALFADTTDPYHKWTLGFFSAVHMLFINPGVFLLSFLAIGAQAKEILHRHHNNEGVGALSLPGLAVQTLLFALLAVTWSGRLVFHWDNVPVESRINWSVFVFWFQSVGFVLFDYGVFAIGQGVLLSLALRHQAVALTGGNTWPAIFFQSDGEGHTVNAGERAPLLG
ncbi:hypothetical protein QBC41DRAFT_330939 [Cercophora samala]|uniref:Uncharacterized protein n=1 Tax=Cercophora samala TaxID=330535 RepID=A0AA40D4X1_9PEZI|nr:hypothetical protein QBC41DRAFT_330939 [Cercophora samala]